MKFRMQNLSILKCYLVNHTEYHSEIIETIMGIKLKTRRTFNLNSPKNKSKFWLYMKKSGINEDWCNKFRGK